MSDSLMTPADVYQAVERVYGRPDFDPCWHPQSPVRPYRAASRHWPLVLNGPGSLRSPPWLEMEPGVLVVHTGREGLDGKWREHARDGWLWLNPPYSAPGTWLSALVASGVPAVALLKADPTTRWWNRWVWGQPCTVGLFRKRLRYLRTDGGEQMQANFPSAIVIYGMDFTVPLPDLDVVWVVPTLGAPVPQDTEMDVMRQASSWRPAD